MGEHRLEDFEDIIRREVRRNRGFIALVSGIDEEDWLQELRAHVAVKCLPRIQKRKGPRAFVQVSVVNAIKNLKRSYTARSRMMRDARGQINVFPELHQNEDGEEVNYFPPASDPSVEHTVIVRDELRLLDERMTRTERKLLMDAMIDGIQSRSDGRKRKRALARARSILNVVLRNDARRLARMRCDFQHRVNTHPKQRQMVSPEKQEMTKMSKSKFDLTVLPATALREDDNRADCHAANPDDEAREGYEMNLADAEVCQDCPDKFTCLPQSIEGVKGVNGGTPIHPKGAIKVDPEVVAVLEGQLSYDDALDRIRRRQQIRDNDGEIPEELMFNNVPTDGEEEEEEEMTDEEEFETEEEEVTDPEEEEGEEGEELLDDEEEEEDDEEEEEPAPPPKKKAKPKKTKAAPKTKAKTKAPAKPKKTKAKAPKKTAPKKTKPKKTAPPPEPKITVLKSGAVKVDGTKIGEVAETEDGWGWWAGDDESPDWLDSKQAAVDGLVAAHAPKGAKTKPKKKRGRKKVDTTGMDIGTILDDGRMVVSSGRFAPAPRELTKEQMGSALERVTLGLPFDLTPGMTLIQERRDGTEIKVKVKPNGFEYEGTVYSSLTAACMWALARSVSGNDMFDFSKHSNIVVKGKGVPGKEYRRGDAE